MMARDGIEKYKFNIDCKASEISPLVKDILIKIEKVENSLDLKFKLELAAREMLANAIEHGCSMSLKNDLEEEEIKIELKIYSDKISLQVQDPGPGFNWKDCDLINMPEFEEKGRGLKFINKVADKIKFNQQGNVITAFFNL